MPLPSRKRPLVRERREYSLDMVEGGVQILGWISLLRFATNIQIQRLVFNRDSISKRMARHRSTRSVRRLFDGDFVRRMEVFAPGPTGRMSRQMINVLSPKGVAALGLLPTKVQRPPNQNAILTHEYWLVELSVRAAEGCPSPLAITECWNDRTMASIKRQGSISLSVIPDGLLVTANQTTDKTYPSFIELDLGSESVNSASRMRSSVAGKIEAYSDYLSAPLQFNQEFGIEGSPIVLFVADSERRLESIRKVTKELGGMGRFWFSTLDRLSRSAVSNGNWIYASDDPQGPFWTSNWQTSQNDELRSLATRCGL